MKTLLTVKEQHSYLADNWQHKTWKHKWSCRGMGNSKIIDARDNVIGKAGGCGYDRYGAAIGQAITTLFGKEVHKLAKRECKGTRRNYKKSEKFYGLFYDGTTDKAWLDGGCGHTCMTKILNKIGFSLQYIGESKQAHSGEQFHSLLPVTKSDKVRLTY